jgi:hypothetical protein
MRPVCSRVLEQAANRLRILDSFTAPDGFGSGSPRFLSFSVALWYLNVSSVRI